MRAHIPNEPSKFTRVMCSVFSGNFPASSVNKMNLAALEKFVLRLVEHTSTQKSAKTLSRIECKPKWWPSDIYIEKCYSKEKIKEFRVTLKKLVLNCCDFFKTYKLTWLPDSKSWINDENFDVIQGLKRRGDEAYHPTHCNKKRKTLLSKSFTADVPNESANIYGGIPDTSTFPYIIEPPVELDPSDQIGFLRLFSLGLNNNTIAKNEKPTFSRLLKFQNCSHIPLSSDTGKLMMKNENYSVPEFVTSRRLERVEWYVNKQNPKFSDFKFEITFVPPKYTHSHKYKFPKRQYHQFKRSHFYNEFLFKLCKSLVVLVENEDLLAKKNLLDSCKQALMISVAVPRVSENILKKHLCKDMQVQIREKVVDKTIKDVQVSRFGRKIKSIKK